MLSSISNVLQQLTTIDYWLSMLQIFQCLGPSVPILLAAIESYIPALPLIAIVTLNITGHGLILGFIYSWAGSCLGSITFFLLIRCFLKKWFYSKIIKIKTFRKGLDWIEKVNSSILFLLAMLPFTPSSFLNLAYGLSNYPKRTYLFIIVVAKFFMILALSLFGGSLKMALHNPIYLLLAVVIYLLLLVVSRSIMKKYNL